MNFRQAGLDEVFVIVGGFVPVEAVQGRMLPNRSVV
jgi:hypothetical protein